MSTALLLAESEPVLARHLSRDGFEVIAEAERPPDLVLGDVDALETWGGAVPVIVLGEEEADTVDRVHAFRRGCDDYVSRPFEYEELVERIRAVLRRAAPAPPERIVAGGIEIERPTRRVTVDGARVELSQKEFELLLKLAEDRARVWTKEELLRDVWGFRSIGRTRTLDSHASRLRRRLVAADGSKPYVVNVWGVGYRLCDDWPGEWAKGSSMKATRSGSTR